MQIKEALSPYFLSEYQQKEKSGNCPLMGRISVDGKSSAFSTGLELSPENGMPNRE